MTYGLKQSAAPSSEPVTARDLATHVKCDHVEEGRYLVGLVEAARDHVETVTGRQLIEAEYTLTLDGFPDDGLTLPRPPLVSVEAIKYDDADGDEQTLSTDKYVVDTNREPGRIELAKDQTWPTTHREINAVRIDYTAGYGDSPEDVPRVIRNAILMLAGHWYENRSPVELGTIATRVPHSVEAMLWGVRVEEVA